MTASKPIRVLAIVTALLIASLAIYEVRWLLFVPADEPWPVTYAFWSAAGAVGAFGAVLAWACARVGIRGE